MRQINLTTRTNKDWTGQFVDDSFYGVLYDETARILKPDGKLLAVVLKSSLGAELDEAWKVLRGRDWSTNNRGSASGSEMKPSERKNGTVGKVMRGESVESGIIGYFERTPRWPYCRACAFNLNHPEEWAKILPLPQMVSSLMAEHVGERYEMQRGIVEKTSPDFVIPGTVFTTITVNRNFRTACHKDAGDLPEGISGMAVASEGKWRGANLVLPDFRIGIKLGHGDLIFFDPHEFHGNTKLIELNSAAVRSSLVFYYRKKIIGCQSAAEELDRAKNRKLGTSLFEEKE